jgi:hypothetical protein
LRLSDKVELDPSRRGTSNHGEEYTARTETGSGAFSSVRRLLQKRFCFAETCLPHFYQI